jgi:hypothetical protein
MALAEIREQIQRLIHNATGAPTHEYERVVQTRDELESIASIILDDGQRIIHGWTITVESDEALPDTAEELVDFTFQRQYAFVLRGYRGHDDAKKTALEWQNTIEALLATFDTNPTLGATAIRSGPAECRIRDDHRFYGEILCHYAEITLDAILKVSRLSS